MSRTHRQRDGIAEVAVSPAAERNKQPILDVLRPRLPASGTVLEIASGTGQHVVHFAAALPGLHWQPSDPDPSACEAIRQRLAVAGLDNVHMPLTLDVRQRPWPVAPPAAILCCNMIHIAPWSAGEALIGEAGALLSAGGALFLYGPFRRHGRHTAESNAAFDADLRARDPDWGVRDLEAVSHHATAAGLVLDEVVPMPANNLIAVYRATGGG